MECWDSCFPAWCINTLEKKIFLVRAKKRSYINLIFTGAITNLSSRSFRYFTLVENDTCTRRCQDNLCLLYCTFLLHAKRLKSSSCLPTPSFYDTLLPRYLRDVIFHPYRLPSKNVELTLFSIRRWRSGSSPWYYSTSIILPTMFVHVCPLHPHLLIFCLPFPDQYLIKHTWPEIIKSQARDESFRDVEIDFLVSLVPPRPRFFFFFFPVLFLSLFLLRIYNST